MMTLLSMVSSAFTASDQQPYPPLAIEITSLLDLAAVAIAIWTLWTTVWLHLGGQLQRAFRLISFGAFAFALSHLLDTILQLLGLDYALLIHQGAVLTAILFFVPGLAGLTESLPSSARQKRETTLQPWPLAVGLVIIVGALSFILYGIGPLAEAWAFVGLDSGLILLSGVCLALVIRARLGGAIGHSLWLALLGLLIFSLAHPLQVWFYEETTIAPSLLGIVHRLIVIPAFFLFAFSLTNVARSVKFSPTVEIHPIA
jgi:hypothetical protein